MTRGLSLRTMVCKSCGKSYEGWPNSYYCPVCKPIKKLERNRISEAKRKGRPVATGKHRCPICGCFKDKAAKTCENCYNRVRHGADNPNWRGGKTESQGYIFVRQGAGKEADYVLEHRLVWEQNHGKLPDGYIIHHLNGVKNDNRLENLAALPRAAHSGSAVLNVFKNRIRQLEAQLKELKDSSQIKLV